MTLGLCRKRETLLLALACAVAMPLQPGHAQQRADVFGTVIDTLGMPVAGAELRVFGLRSVAHTDDEGGFQLLGFVPGSYVLQVRRLGFESRTLIMSVDSARRSEMTIRLTPVPLQLASVDVSADRPPALNEFERRRNANFGTGAVFMTRGEIEQIPASRLSDLFRRVPGVTLLQNRIGRYHIIMTRTTSVRACPPTLYLDGVILPTDPNLGIDFIDPAMIEGLEVYRGPSEVPPEFNGRDAACGVVVIWTRAPGASAK